VEEGADEGEADDDGVDEELGPVTRKAFSTCENGEIGADQPTPGRKLVSVLRELSPSSCTSCTDGGRSSPASFVQRTVCFSDNLVTDTHERPRTENEEVNDHYYTLNDFRRFKRQARDEGHCEQQLIRMLRDICASFQDCEGDFG